MDRSATAIGIIKATSIELKLKIPMLLPSGFHSVILIKIQTIVVAAIPTKNPPKHTKVFSMKSFLRSLPLEIPMVARIANSFFLFVKTI